MRSPVLMLTFPLIRHCLVSRENLTGNGDPIRLIALGAMKATVEKTITNAGNLIMTIRKYYWDFRIYALWINFGCV